VGTGAGEENSLLPTPSLGGLLEQIEAGAVLLIDSTLRVRMAAGPLLAAFHRNTGIFAWESVFDVLPSDMAELAMPHFERALQGVPNSVELSHLDYVVLSHAVPLPGETYVDAIIVFMQDITQQREALHRLRAREAEARLRLAELEAIYDTAPIGLGVLDTDMRFVRVNARLAAMNGVPVAAHIGRTIQEVVPGLADVADVYFRQVFDSGQPIFNVELTGETPAAPGVLRTWLEHLTPLHDEAGALIGANIVVEEVTERKRAEQALRESEERLSVAVKTAPILVYQCDRQLRYVWMHNPTHGFSLEDVIGKRDEELLPADYVRELVALKQEVLDTQTTLRREISLGHYDGRSYDYDITAEPFYDASGSLLGLTVAALDITSHKETQRQLQQLTESLERRVEEGTGQVRHLASELSIAEQRERRRIAQILHDDIQQMLVAHQISLNLLAAGPGAELAASLRDADQAISDIIEASRTLALDLSPPVLFSDSLRDSFRWLTQHMDDKYRLRVELDVTGECLVPDSDLREMIVRLVQELLFNIVKHAGVNSARLRAEQQNALLRVQVEDDGKGFEPAEQHGGPGTKSFGLYSIRERLQLFGGEIQINSAPGAGTHVTLVLPHPAASS
jgi:PAS domain S-box-containing protein